MPPDQDTMLVGPDLLWWGIVAVSIVAGLWAWAWRRSEPARKRWLQRRGLRVGDVVDRIGVDEFWTIVAIDGDTFLLRRTALADGAVTEVSHRGESGLSLRFRTRRRGRR